MVEFYEILVYILAYIGLFATSFYVVSMIKSYKKSIYPPKDDKTVTIIIPAYNEEKSIARTIESALSIDYPKNKLNIIVVDDGSKDKTYEIAKKFQSKKFPIVQVFTKPNGGKGSALNLGISKSKSEIIISMDADTFTNPDCLKKMIGYFHSKDVMAVTPSMGVYQPHGILQRIQQVEYYMGVFLRKSFSTVNAIHVTPGAFSAYRREFFVKHGDYEVGNITEDLEICLRIQSNHYLVENAPDAAIYTIAPNAFKALMYQRRRWYTGLMKNLWTYRHLFGPKYGSLGTVVLPVAVTTIVLSVILTVYLIIKTLIETKQDLLDLIAINFQFNNWMEINSFVLEHFFYSVFSQKLFLITILFLFLLGFYMYFSRKKMLYSEGIRLSFVFFIAFYSLLFTFWWILSFIYVLFNKKVKWRES